MSATFALPLFTAEHFSHGKSYSDSAAHVSTRPRSHQRTRASSRLAPPFIMPRIPSESLVPREQDYKPVDKSVLSKDSQNDSYHAKAFIPTPQHHDHGVLPGKRGTSELDSDGFTPVHNHVHQRPRLVSRPTELLLKTTEPYSLIHGILAERDSRRIFYFMCLNLAFMMVQSTYGFLTGSLGLISDSIHMFFDCIALFVGICAAVMSKWPASTKFPYGYGKLDTLAGLANGIFLMLISVEIIYEAVERLFSGSDISRTTELLVVSSAGLAVNLIGIFAFEHGHHHGHSHGHSHGHDHHDHVSSQQPNSGTDHSHSLSATSVTFSPQKREHSHHGHGHHHGSENMQGIYLHIMADALGSVAVVISTLLVQYTGWSGFDPLASCIIAVLIFASAVPLVVSTAQILLLSLDSDIEYNLRDILGGVSEIRGVVGYTVPKFWLDDIAKKEAETPHNHEHHQTDHHPHHHDHHHDHAHEHNHFCDGEATKVSGVMHVIVNEHANMPEIRQRLSNYLDSRSMNIVVQLERETEGRCYCGGLKTG